MINEFGYTEYSTLEEYINSPEYKDWSAESNDNLESVFTLATWIVGVGLVVLATGAIALTAQDITGSNYRYCLEVDLNKATNIDDYTPGGIWRHMDVSKEFNFGTLVREGVWEGNTLRVEKNPIKRPGYEWDYKVFSHSKVILEGGSIVLQLEENPQYSKLRKVGEKVDSKLDSLAERIADKVAAKILANLKKKSASSSESKKEGK